MDVGRQHAGEQWTEILYESAGNVVIIDSKGYGVFPGQPRSCGVWIDSRAEGRQTLDRLSL